MRLTRILETPRVTKPYSEAAVAGDRCGRQGGRRQAGGRRRAPQHGRRADLRGRRRHAGPGVEPGGAGPDQAQLCREADPPPARALRPGGLLHYGQGKWYPGESLPRWAYRRLLAQRRRAAVAQSGPDRSARRRKSPATVADAERFAAALGRQLGLPPAAAMPAYEDPVHFMLAEQKLPVGIEPEDEQARRSGRAQAADARVRARLGQAGRLRACRSWRASPARRAALAHAALGLQARPPVPAAGRLAGRPAAAARLAGRAAAARVSRRAARSTRWASRRRCRSAHVLDDEQARRCGGRPRRRCARRMAIEARDGHLCIFLPPLANAEDFAALVAAIEQVAAASNRPGAPGRLHAAGRSAPQQHQGDARPRRDRGQRASGDVVGAGGRHHHRRLRGSRAGEARRREVHARRTARRHRRRQPHRAGRHHAEGQPVPAPARSARQHRHLLAEPSLAVLPVLGAVHRPHQPGAARRRGAARIRSTSWRSRCADSGSRGGDHRAVAGRSPVPQPAGRRDRATRIGPRSASTSCTRRKGRPAGWGWSSSAPSRCRRMRA